MDKKKLLVLSFFPAFSPPKSGGELRLYNICKNLSKYYDITILSFTHPSSDEKYQNHSLFPNVNEIRIPKNKLHGLLHHIFYKYGHIPESSGVVVSIASHFNKTYKNIFNNLIKDSQIIISTHPYMYKNIKDKMTIYESYNMEYKLQKKAFGESIIAKLLSLYVYYIEKNASLSSDIIFAVSEEDKNDFHYSYKAPLNKIFLAPNGVDLEEIKGSTVDEKDINKTKLNLNKTNTLLFIGSAHPPNIEAAKIIIDKLAPSLPEFTFLIAGKVSDYLIDDRFEMKILNENDTETLFSNMDTTGLLTHGWYHPEYWNNIVTRWTKKTFGFAAKDIGISKIFFKIFSIKETQVNIQLNGTQIGHIILKPNEWTYYDFEFNITDKIISTITVDETIKEPNGNRTLGVAIQEIGYESEGTRKKIKLENSFEMRTISAYVSKNVKIFGLISDETKKTLLKASDAALNPLTYGSGTNLKMLDYMAAELPIITTPIGARGLDIINNVHAIICDINEFEKNILGLFKDEDFCKKLKENGRILVEEKYDWTKIADKMFENIEICYEKKNSRYK